MAGDAHPLANRQNTPTYTFPVVPTMQNKANLQALPAGAVGPRLRQTNPIRWRLGVRNEAKLS